MKRRRKNLGNHELSARKNLACESDKGGMFNRYQCINCGEEFKCYAIMGIPKSWPGPCYVSKENYTNILQRREAAINASKEVYGCWAYGSDDVCPHCKAALVLCPRKGHYMSRFWRLEQDDGAKLMICPNDCKV